MHLLIRLKPFPGQTNRWRDRFQMSGTSLPSPGRRTTGTSRGGPRTGSTSTGRRGIKTSSIDGVTGNASLIWDSNPDRDSKWDEWATTVQKLVSSYFAFYLVSSSTYEGIRTCVFKAKELYLAFSSIVS